MKQADLLASPLNIAPEFSCSTFPASRAASPLSAWYSRQVKHGANSIAVAVLDRTMLVSTHRWCGVARAAFSCSVGGGSFPCNCCHSRRHHHRLSVPAVSPYDAASTRIAPALSFGSIHGGTPPPRWATASVLFYREHRPLPAKTSARHGATLWPRSLGEGRLSIDVVVFLRFYHVTSRFTPATS